MGAEEEEVLKCVVRQEAMAALGGHWASALFSGEGAVLCLISPFLLLFANRNICLLWIQRQAAGPTCGGRGPGPQVSWLQAVPSRGARPLQAYERSY